MGYKWTDARELAEELYDNEPELDPVTLRLSEKKVPFFGPRGCDPNATARPAAGGL